MAPALLRACDASRVISSVADGTHYLQTSQSRASCPPGSFPAECRPASHTSVFALKEAVQWPDDAGKLAFARLDAGGHVDTCNLSAARPVLAISSPTRRWIFDTAPDQPEGCLANAVVQAGAPHTGTTLLCNFLQGMLGPRRACSYDIAPSNLIIKSHVLDAVHFDSVLRGRRVFIVTTRREGERWVEDPTNRTLAVDYDTLTHDLPRVYSQVRAWVASHASLAACRVRPFSVAEARVRRMNAVVERMAHMDFFEAEPFYLVHGQHRSADRETAQRAGAGPPWGSRRAVPRRELATLHAVRSLTKLHSSLSCSTSGAQMK